ncbi:MAG: class I SAM-dependent methyltransferase [Candidatus Dormibacteria bacterium]
MALHAPSDKAALRGEPSYVWRAGQERRLQMILEAAPMLRGGRVLEHGCGVGLYVQHLREHSASVHGFDFELARVKAAAELLGPALLTSAAGEELPYADNSFDVLLSNEVIEHVADDRRTLAEMSRVVRPGGRIVIFCPNRWYPVEQHGVYWKGVYHFGNIPLVNYLPDVFRDRLAPHVRTYTRRSLRQVYQGLPVREVAHSRIFGGYDNIVRRFGRPGLALRTALHSAEGTPFDLLALSHLLVLEKV